MKTVSRGLPARAAVLAVALALSPAPSVSWAGEARPVVADPVIEARMAALSAQLRCLVCQGQSIAESGSDFANDVRREMLRLMEQGRSDQEVIDFLVQRYGDFILFRPPVKGTTLLLWLGPFLLLLAGGSALFVTLRRRRQAADAVLSPEEQQRAERLLEGSADDGRSGDHS
ncbi:MAG TPA: cytochrome c-type biogenesis protein CcmH [Gammaproteobacteria bacterium]|nr:cytochrome c-type biogenesis protein CcmH [Gammaproteobacteria bacterium]